MKKIALIFCALVALVASNNASAQIAMGATSSTKKDAFIYSNTKMGINQFCVKEYEGRYFIEVIDAESDGALSFCIGASKEEATKSLTAINEWAKNANKKDYTTIDADGTEIVLYKYYKNGLYLSDGSISYLKRKCDQYKEQAVTNLASALVGSQKYEKTTRNRESDAKVGAISLKHLQKATDAIKAY